MKFSKSVFEYDSYRSFLKECYLNSKSKDPKFSFRYFSRIIGSKSPSLFKHIIDGHRNLTLHHVEALIRSLNMNTEESFYFRNLVQLNQAKTVEEKQRFAKRILQSKSYKKVHPLSAAQYAYFDHWYYVPIRELVGVSGFKENAKWIAQKLNFSVSEQEIRSAISTLLKLGLIKRSMEGKLIQSQCHVTTVDSIVSSALAKSHQDLLKLGIESIDKIPRHQREILGVTFSLSQRNFEKVKEKVMNFRRELVEYLSAENNQDSIYQFHLLLFPLAQIQAEKK